MTELPPCPKCKSTFTYEMDQLLNCPECGHAWNAIAESAAETSSTEEEVVKDSNGAVLQNGDSDKRFAGERIFQKHQSRHQG